MAQQHQTRTYAQNGVRNVKRAREFRRWSEAHRSEGAPTRFALHKLSVGHQDHANVVRVARNTRRAGKLHGLRRARVGCIVPPLSSRAAVTHRDGRAERADGGGCCRSSCLRSGCESRGHALDARLQSATRVLCVCKHCLHSARAIERVRWDVCARQRLSKTERLCQHIASDKRRLTSARGKEC